MKPCASKSELEKFGRGQREDFWRGMLEANTVTQEEFDEQV